MIPACAAPHINSPNADTANMLFLGTSGLSSISDMSDRGQKLPPSSASVLQLLANSSGISQITSIPPELGHNRHRISRRCQDRLLPVLVVRGLSGAAGRANRRYAAILSPAAGEPASVVDVVLDCLEVFPGFALGFLIVLAQQVRRVIRDHHGDLLPLEPLAAHLGDAFLVAREGAGGDAAERADHLGADRQ